LLTPREATGKGLGVVADILQVAGHAAEGVLAGVETLAPLGDVAALDRLDGASEGVGIEPPRPFSCKG